jgi:hypothetical protein
LRVFAAGPITFFSSGDKSLIPFKISFNFQVFQRKSFSNASNVS